MASVRIGLWRIGPLLLAAAGGIGPRGEASEPVASLVSALGSPSRQERERAEAAVVARGPAILGELSRLAPLTVGEARLRLERATATLEKRLIERDLEPTAITLSVDRVPVREVLRRLAAESVNEIELSQEVSDGEAGARPVSLVADRDTYWEVVIAALSQASLTVACDGEGRGVRVVEAAADAPKPAAAGPFLVLDRGVEVGRGGMAGKPVRVRIALAWESRLQPLVIRVPMQSVEAEGPSGESIPPSSRLAVLEAAVLPGSRWIPLVLPLTAPGPLPERLAVVRATVRTWLAAGEHDFELDLGAVGDAARGVRVGSADVRLDTVWRDGRRLVVAAEAAYDGPAEPLASHRSWIVERPLSLAVAGRAADGPILPSERSVRHRSDTGLGIAATFLLPEDTRPLAVRWRLPAALREVPYDILLRDIPLSPR